MLDSIASVFAIRFPYHIKRLRQNRESERCRTLFQDEKGAFCWEEWRMVLNSTESAIEVDGRPLAVSAAYSGRVAVAFKVGSSFTRPTKGNEDDRYVNLAVSIYECGSTGGSEWMLEDTVSLSSGVSGR